MNKNSIFENISTRRSIRAFTQQPIAKADLETIVQAGAWAPTAMNRQTFQFTVISRQEEIERLASILGKEMGNAAYDFYKLGSIDSCFQRAGGDQSGSGCGLRYGKYVFTGACAGNRLSVDQPV